MLTCSIASAPSLQLAVDLLSDLADGVQDVTNDYEEAVERAVDGSITQGVDGEVDESKQPHSLLIKSNLLFSKFGTHLIERDGAGADP